MLYISATFCQPTRRQDRGAEYVICQPSTVKPTMFAYFRFASLKRNSLRILFGSWARLDIGHFVFNVIFGPKRSTNQLQPRLRQHGDAERNLNRRPAQWYF